MNWNKSAKENQAKRARKISLIFLFCCIFFSFFIPHVHATRQMEMVAYVTDKNGQLVTGDYNVRFALYSEDRTDSSASDTQGKLWEETQSVAIKNGVVRVTLGQNKELPIVTSLESGQLFLGMKIGEDSEMVPRKKVVSSIYSLSSGNAISLNGKKTGNSAGDIPVLDSAGKIELTNLPDSVLGGGSSGSGLSFSTSGQKYLTVSGQQLKLNKINLNSSTQGTLSIGQGGTGLTTAPTDGEIMIGNSAGGYTLGKFSASGNLLQLANNTFSIKEGALTEGRLCTYSLTQGLVCDTTPSAGGVETDPIFVSSAASSISNANVSNWNAAYGWGNHGSQGYLTGTKVDSFNNRTGIISLSSLDVSNALTFAPYSATNPTGFITASTVDNLTNKSGNISMWNNNVGYLSSFTEVDPALSTWAGSANLSTLGTITSGTWRGNAIATSYGGTGLASYVAGDMLYANGTNLSKLPIGGNGQVLVVSSGIPTWSSTTPGTAHSFLSSSHSDTTASSPQRGDIITGQGATASWTKLSVGTSGQVLKSDGADAYWGTDTDTNTTYARSGSLLQLTGTTFSIKEGTLTDTRICTYSSTNGLVCDTSPGAGGSTYTAGNDLNLIGTQFNLDSQLDHVSTISQSSANLTFQTLISGNILLNSIGNVGIGTGAPSQKLQIVGYADATGLCINGSCKTSWNSAGIGTDYAAGNDIDITNGQIDLESQLDLVSVINRTANDLTLQTTASGNIFLMPNQNVGIGTINPLQKVDVNGNLTATAIYTNNTIRISNTGALTNVSGNISQFTNNMNYITDGNTNWDNSYNFITASSLDNLTNKSGNISMWTNNAGYLSSFTEVDPTLSTWTGSTNLATVGTITTGTWRGNTLSTVYGGTGLTNYNAGDLLYYSSGTNLSKLALGGNSQVLKSNGANVYWGADLNGTTYASGGNLLQLSGSTFSVKEGTMTSGRFCSYDGTNLVCDTASADMMGTETDPVFVAWKSAPSLANQLVSSVTTGTAPLQVASITKVANLNADLLDGFDSSAFGDATAANQTTILTRIGTNSDVASMSSSLFAGQEYIAGAVDVIKDKLDTPIDTVQKVAAGTYFTVGGKPKYCQQQVIDGTGNTTTTNINEGSSCDTGKTCTSGACGQTAPTNLNFTDQNGATINTLVESNILQILGTTTASSVSIAGDGSPEFRICADSNCLSILYDWGTTSHSVNNNQYLQLRLTSSSTNLVTNTATVTVGTGSGNWNVTVGNDNNPDAFNFADQTGVNTASQISSDILQVTGINVATNVSISGNGTPQFRICSDNTCGTEIITWGNTAQTINNNQYLQLRLTSSGAQTTTSTASVVVGTGSDSWSVTTGDNAPATFSFTNQAMVSTSAITSSDIIQIADITVPAAVTITGAGGPQFRVCDDITCVAVAKNWGSTAQTISNNQYLQLRLMSPSNYSQTNSAVVTVGSGSSNWSVSTGDNTPTAFTFTDQSGVATNTLFSSNILQITGINIASAVSISGSGSPQFRICSDSTCVAEVNTWGSGAQTITNNQYLQLRLTSGASYSIINSAIINVGLGASTWNVATLDNTPDAFSFTNQTSLNLNTSTASNTIQITGITMPSAVTISGSGTPEFRICDDASCYTILQDWGSAGQNISNNQYIQLRLTSSGSYATTDTVTVSIGAGTTNWTAKTKEQYALDASAGANGTISPTGTLTANQGDTQVYTFTPSAHYHVSNITVDGVSQTLANSYTFANIQAAHTISVAFAADTFTITATNGANGSVSPGTTTLGYNANQTFTISPYANFHIVDVLVDSVSVGAVGTYTFNNISANHTLAATFAASDITINSSAGANGTITPLGASSVTYGANQTFVINPYSGYQIAGVAVDSVSVGAVGSYTFNNVTTNHTINAWFAPIAFTLTYSAGANGFISGTPTQTVGYGANGTAVTATGNGIYAFGSWSDGSTQNPRTDTNVTTNITVTANFINPYTVECTPATAIGAKCGGGIKYADGYVAMPPGCTDVTNEPTCNVPGYLTDTVTKYYSASAFDEPADSLTNGRLNTNSLMGNPADNGSATDSLAPNDPAALYCFNMILNTKTDWYLPAKDELNVLYGQRVAVGGFFAGTYWSSSENTVTNVGYYAWNQNFSTGAQGGSNYKYSSSYYVRCIRAY